MRIDMTLAHEIDPEHWRDAAACGQVGDEIDFFPSPEDREAIARATAICASCPVVDECLSYAMETRQSDGIWGGLTPAERVRLRRRWQDELRKAG